MTNNDHIVFGVDLIKIHEWAGRGLEVISSNVCNSSTVSPISFKLDLMTSVGGEVHVLVVHCCILLIIHRLKEHSHFIKNSS